MNQRHYNGETYQLQLDSHHRFEKDWDTMCIELLHSCDDGEYSVLTHYLNNFDLLDPADPNSEIEKWVGWRTNFIMHFNLYYPENRLYLSSAGTLWKNEEKLTKPFRALWYSAHFAFSHGHFVSNAGYDS